MHVHFSKTFEEHLAYLENVCRQLELHGLKLKGSKCEFFLFIFIDTLF